MEIVSPLLPLYLCHKHTNKCTHTHIYTHTPSAEVTGGCANGLRQYLVVGMRMTGDDKMS